jgi:hypothetical protein
MLTSVYVLRRALDGSAHRQSYKKCKPIQQNGNRDREGLSPIGWAEMLQLRGSNRRAVAWNVVDTQSAGGGSHRKEGVVQGQKRD